MSKSYESMLENWTVEEIKSAIIANGGTDTSKQTKQEAIQALIALKIPLEDAWDKWTIEALRDACRNANVTTSGQKQGLIARLTIVIGATPGTKKASSDDANDNTDKPLRRSSRSRSRSRSPAPDRKPATNRRSSRSSSPSRTPAASPTSSSADDTNKNDTTSSTTTNSTNSSGASSPARDRSTSPNPTPFTRAAPLSSFTDHMAPPAPMTRIPSIHFRSRPKSWARQTSNAGAIDDESGGAAGFRINLTPTRSAAAAFFSAPPPGVTLVTDDEHTASSSMAPPPTRTSKRSRSKSPLPPSSTASSDADEQQTTKRARTAAATDDDDTKTPTASSSSSSSLALPSSDNGDGSDTDVGATSRRAEKRYKGGKNRRKRVSTAGRRGATSDATATDATATDGSGDKKDEDNDEVDDTADTLAIPDKKPRGRRMPAGRSSASSSSTLTVGTASAPRSISPRPTRPSRRSHKATDDDNDENDGHDIDEPTVKHDTRASSAAAAAEVAAIESSLAAAAAAEAARRPSCVRDESKQYGKEKRSIQFSSTDIHVYTMAPEQGVKGDKVPSDADDFYPVGIFKWVQGIRRTVMQHETKKWTIRRRLEAKAKDDTKLDGAGELMDVDKRKRVWQHSDLKGDDDHEDLNVIRDGRKHIGCKCHATAKRGHVCDTKTCECAVAGIDCHSDACKCGPGDCKNDHGRYVYHEKTVKRSRKSVLAKANSEMDADRKKQRGAHAGHFWWRDEEESELSELSEAEEEENNASKKKTTTTRATRSRSRSPAPPRR